MFVFAGCTTRMADEQGDLPGETFITVVINTETVSPSNSPAHDDTPIATELFSPSPEPTSPAYSQELTDADYSNAKNAAVAYYA